MIYVLPLGPGDPDLLTGQTVRQLRSGLPLILRTARHGIVKWLEEEKIPFDSLDAFYDRYEDFDEMHLAMSQHLTRLAETQDLLYAVPDPSTDGSVFTLSGMTDVAILPGVSLTSFYLARLPGECPRSATVLTGTASDLPEPRTDAALLITELNSREIAGDLKLRLMDLYPDDLQTVFLTEKEEKTVPLYDLDRQDAYSHLTALYVPPLPFEQRQRYEVRDLMSIMRILRAPDGCPWDRVQTHESLRNYLIEEAYEAAGAMDEHDMDHLADELGDVLLQIVFHAAIGETSGDFNLTDIATCICRKMIHRHPHVFAHDGNQGPDSWEKLKKEERGFTSLADALRDVTPALPALLRAEKIQNRTYRAIRERQIPEIMTEIQELVHKLQDQDGTKTHHAMGLLLLDCVEIARQRNQNAEDLLQKATESYMQKIIQLEEMARKDKKSLESLTLQEIKLYFHTVSGT